jgi:glutamine cyclotransferase
MRPRLVPFLVTVAVALLAAGCRGQGAERLGVEIVAQHTHDPQAFTQGLVWHEGTLYESTGLLGRSSLREVRLDGTVLRKRDLAANMFGEGLELVGDELLQLTWQNGVLLRYDATTFEPTGTQRYAGEGWGLCFDGAALWMSDGSAKLTKRDPVTFEVEGSVEVSRDGKPLTMLNELECVAGSVYANVWTTDEIVRIDPTSGRVTAVVDASELRRVAGVTDRDAVLNGIAYDEASGNFMVTGKLWPVLFEVRFVGR